MLLPKMCSLTELCLNIIYKHFSRYVAFSCTEDARLGTGLSFLRRVYSQALLDHLSYKRELGDDKAEFLLNEYLKKLDLALLLENIRKEKIIEKVSKFAHNLVELFCVAVLNGSRRQDCLYTLNALLPHSNFITNICLPGICNDETLKNIASSCPNLIQLNVCYSEEITSAGFQALCYVSDATIRSRCPLEKLNLIGSSATVKDISFLLTHITTLQELKSKHVPKAVYSIFKYFLKTQFPNERKIYNLISLNFYSYSPFQIYDLLPLCAKLCPLIKKLKLNVLESNDALLSSRFLSLDSLYLRGFIGFINVENFLREKGEKLKHFTAHGLELSISTLITSCPNLESLKIKVCEYLSPNEKDLGVLNHLHTLEFQAEDPDDVKYLELLLNSSPMLERIVLEFLDVSDTDMYKMLEKYLKTAALKQLYARFRIYRFDELRNFILSCKNVESVTVHVSTPLYTNDIQKLYDTTKTYNREIKIKYHYLNEVKIYCKEFPTGLITKFTNWSYFGDHEYNSSGDNVHYSCPYVTISSESDVDMSD